MPCFHDQVSSTICPLTEQGFRQRAAGLVATAGDRANRRGDKKLGRNGVDEAALKQWILDAHGMDGTGRHYIAKFGFFVPPLMTSAAAQVLCASVYLLQVPCLAAAWGRRRLMRPPSCALASSTGRCRCCGAC